MPRGGARPGAGAPPVPEDQKRKNITLTLGPTEAEWIREQNRKGAAILSAFIQGKKAEGTMKYFGTSDKPSYLTGKEYLPMARTYWGQMPLPIGAELVGGYSDKDRAGALIRMKTGIYVCGNAGAISNITQPVNIS